MSVPSVPSINDAKGLDNEVEERKILIKTSDGEELWINNSFIESSGLTKTALNKDNNCKELKLDFTYEILKHIISYVEKYKGNFPIYKKPLVNSLKNTINKWDFKYIDKDFNFLSNLINSSNYLDIEPLLDLSCMKVASLIKGKPLNEVKKILKLNLQN
jgi:S-phase kinase-associated protein 1